jgi:hypothetical protein
MDNEEFPSAVEGSANNVVFGGDIFPREEVLENIFTYHAPTGDQPAKYVRIREAAKLFAYVLHSECAPGPDRTAAMRHLREAVMTANQSIATHNAIYR